MNIKAIVFDYDGTLIDSNACKHDAFFNLFPEPEKVQGIVQEVMNEIGALSRHVIIPEILKRVRHKLPDIELEEPDSYICKYRDLVLKAQETCEEMPGAGKALTDLAPIFSLYISTVTPQEDIDYLLGKRGWEALFKGVYGYPNDKADVLNKVAEAEGVPVNEICMIGDGSGDRKAAEETGSGFVFVDDSFHFPAFTEGLLAFM